MNTMISYTDIVTKQAVEDWADDKGFVAEDQLSLHMEEKFGAHSVHVTDANDQGDFLILQVTTDCWEEPREFALLPDGALSW